MKRSGHIGDIYTYLTIVGYVRNSQYRCRCICGTEKSVRITDLTRGNIKSCGCKMIEMRLASKAQNEAEEELLRQKKNQPRPKRYEPDYS